MFDSTPVISSRFSGNISAPKGVAYDGKGDPFREENAKVLSRLYSYIDTHSALVASDFDGVVGFTERRQMRNFGAAVIELVGHRLSDADKANLTYEALAPRMLGKSEAEIMGILKKEYDLPGTVEELVKFRGDLYYKSMKESTIQANPFVVALFERSAESSGRKPIIVSNGRQKIQVGLLKHFGCDHLVGDVHTSDTMLLHLPVTKRKKAFFEELVSQHGRVVVLEDSASMAGHVEKLGAKVAYVKHALNGHNDYVPKSGLVFRCASLVS